MLNHEHFFNPKFKIVNHKKKPPPVVKVYDKLFYTIYHKRYEQTMFLEKYNETIEKIKVTEQLELLNIKHKNKLLDDLQNPNIQLFTLNSLCLVWNMNIVWYSDYCYHEFIVNDLYPIYYLSESYKWTNKPDNLLYKINDIFKPLRSITYYKLAELKQMANTMNIIGKTKKELYDQIVNYFKHSKLI